MQCKKCDVDLAAHEVRMVASWAFCDACFDALLSPKRAAAEPAPSPDEARADEPPPAPTVASGRCQLCDVELPLGELTAFGFWHFCRPCFGSLGDEARAGREEPPAGEEPDLPREPVLVEPMRFVQCAGCGRRIPEGGSKTIGEAPHCPDCHARLSVAAEAQAGPAGAAAPPTEDAPGGCEACDRVTRTMHEIDGFRLCAACVSTSPELAMDVARARHRERLTRLLG